MNTNVGTREEWLAARIELLGREKELTRLSDELAKQRRELPRVRIEQDWEFETTSGKKTLAELFDGRSQLIVYHFMHGPNTPEGCTGCTFATDSFDGTIAHLNAHDVTFVLASRSPLEVLQAYKSRMGWDIPWVSSAGTDFNRYFSAWTEEDRRNGTGWNFGSPGGASVDVVNDQELMALSIFVLEDGVVYHTYTCYDRGTDALNTAWQLLDRTPKGRDEGAVPGWPLRHDEYRSGNGATVPRTILRFGRRLDRAPDRTPDR
jgi:predicted dithiol-disulfide oxidoreductase (DUF899 family)